VVREIKPLKAWFDSYARVSHQRKLIDICDAGKACNGTHVLQQRTVGSLCQALEASNDANNTSSATSLLEFSDVTGPGVLSSGQQQMLMLHSLDPTSGFYNQPLVLGLYGAVDVALLEKCIQVRSLFSGLSVSFYEDLQSH